MIENAYGDAIAHVFLAASPLALVALVAVLFLREVPLRTTIDVEEVPAAGPAVHDPDTAPAPLHRPALAGVVRRGEQPAPGAVLTVVDADGQQLGRAVSGGDGSYTVDTRDAGRPHLLVVQWHGTPHVEALGGATGPQYRDVALPGALRAARPQPHLTTAPGRRVYELPVAPSRARTASASASPASSQVIRSSRRNHDRWRRTSRRVATIVRRRASSRSIVPSRCSSTSR